jgi:hypothetical protein
MPRPLTAGAPSPATPGQRGRPVAVHDVVEHPPPDAIRRAVSSGRGAAGQGGDGERDAPAPPFRRRDRDGADRRSPARRGRAASGRRATTSTVRAPSSRGRRAPTSPSPPRRRCGRSRSPRDRGLARRDDSADIRVEAAPPSPARTSVLTAPVSSAVRSGASRRRRPRLQREGERGPETPRRGRPARREVRRCDCRRPYVQSDPARRTRRRASAARGCERSGRPTPPGATGRDLSSRRCHWPAPLLPLRDGLLVLGIRGR